MLIAEWQPGASSLSMDVAWDRQWFVMNGYGPDACLLLAEKCRPDLVLIDGVASILFALDLLHSIRSSGTVGGTAVIVIGTPANEADEIRALDAGADDFVALPLRHQQLSLRAQGIIDRRSLSREDAVLQYADISMDVSRRTVSRDGVRIDLRPTQFRLLWHFVGAPGEVFSRKAISHILWPGEEDMRLARTIDVHIRLLRKKLNQGGRPDLICTAKGGYGLRMENDILGYVLNPHQLAGVTLT